MKKKLVDSTIVVMCGGRGRRMGKTTQKIPKSLVKLKGKSILEWKLEHYTMQSYKNFILCVGYQGDKLRRYIKPKFKLAHIHDSGLEAGILRRLFNVKERMSPVTIVSYGDTFAKLDLDNLLLRHMENQTMITFVVAPTTNHFGIVNWDSNSKVTNFVEKPILNHFIGYFVINREALEYIPKKVIDLPDGEGIVTMFQILIAMKQAKIYEFEGLKFTINTPTELKDAKKIAGHFFTLEENIND